MLICSVWCPCAAEGGAGVEAAKLRLATSDTKLGKELRFLKCLYVILYFVSLSFIYLECLLFFEYKQLIFHRYNMMLVTVLFVTNSNLIL